MNDPDLWSLPDHDHRFSLGIHLGNAAEYFGPSVDRVSLLAERRHWLVTDPQRYAAVMPDADPFLAEVELLARDWGFIPTPTATTQFERMLDLGRQLEPDLVLLKPGDADQFVVVGGCVCFPSFWRLTDKMNSSMELVHSPVPGLNSILGSSINRYLSQMKRGSCWLRANWGLSNHSDLNEHPDRGPRVWERPLSLERIWIRREDQAILSLPSSGGVLFGIRVVVRTVAELLQSTDKARLLVRGLRTMPDDMVLYKGFHEIRDELINLLESTMARTELGQ